MRRSLIAGAALAVAAGGALADLYRWMDPETGSVKFSSIAPPWYGKPELERRMPQVEHIAPGKDPVPAREPAAAPPAREPAAAPSARAAGPRPDVAGLEAARKALGERLAAARTRDDPRARQEQLAAYQALSAELDRLDPRGAPARRAETQALLGAQGAAGAGAPGTARGAR